MRASEAAASNTRGVAHSAVSSTMAIGVAGTAGSAGTCQASAMPRPSASASNSRCGVIQ
ncbi:hypothetical protein [Xanthomonas albilineans]|uniref:hypothetical protein n=1 Tax=Xanthomonas albilineans TaxID=29447 RepID=UPI0020136AD5|nr:hypothetical protein [Xanthomonas albilineans]